MTANLHNRRNPPLIITLFPSSLFFLPFLPSFLFHPTTKDNTHTHTSFTSLALPVGRSVGGRPQLSLAPRQLLRPLPPRSKRRRQLPIYGIAETLLLASHDGRRICPRETLAEHVLECETEWLLPSTLRELFSPSNDRGEREGAHLWHSCLSHSSE